MNHSARPVAVALLVACTRWLDDLADPSCVRREAAPPSSPPPPVPRREFDEEITARHPSPPPLLFADGR